MNCVLAFLKCSCSYYANVLWGYRPFESAFVMKVFWPFLPIFQRLLLVLPFLSYINYCANGFLCYAVYVNHLLCRSSNSFSISSSKCPLVVKSWKLLNSFDMIWDGNKVLEKVVESSASSWTTHGVAAYVNVIIISDSEELVHKEPRTKSITLTVKLSFNNHISFTSMSNRCNKECQKHTTLFENNSKCRIWKFEGIFHQFLSY